MRWLLAPGLLVVLGIGCSGSGSGGGTGATGAGGGAGATGGGGGAGAAEAGGGAGNGGAAGDAGPDAPGCATPCSGACADLQNDPSNCGSCGHICAANKTCVAGKCTCTAAGQLDCGSGCIDVTADDSNCGACNHSCGPYQTCVAGSCTCASGLVCGGKCVPPNDPLNCGTCGTQCGPAQLCTSGVCNCYSGLTMCGGTCVDLTNDKSHCGSCANACLPGEACSSSTCSCPGLTNLWCASANTCIDKNTDNNNCGACDVVCPPGSTCSLGKCACNNYGMTICGQTCVDLETDAKHCGSCSYACPTVEFCSGGACYCPAPVVGTPVRLTTSAVDTGQVSAAWDGTHVGVVYMDGGTLDFALLNPDGTRANPTDTLVTSGPAGNPRVVWNGSGYGALWSDGYGAMFIRISASGALVGSAASACSGGSFLPSLAWSTSYGGYAAVCGGNNSVEFRRIGADGTAPDAPVDISVGFGNATALAAAPDGTWQFAANGSTSGTPGTSIIQIKPDGSTIALQAGVPDQYGLGAGPQAIVYEAGAFLTTWVSDSPYDSMVQATRDQFSSYTLISTPSNSLNPAHNISYVVLAPGASSTVAVGWTQRANYGTPYTYQVARFNVPTGTGKLTALTTPVAVVPTNSVPTTDEPIALVSTGTYSLLALWSDNSGGAADLWAVPLDLQACP